MLVAVTMPPRHASNGAEIALKADDRVALRNFFGQCTVYDGVYFHEKTRQGDADIAPRLL
jgi:hypothetical protein